MLVMQFLLVIATSLTVAADDRMSSEPVATMDWSPITTLFACGPNECNNDCAGSDHKITAAGENNTNDPYHTCDTHDREGCEGHQCNEEEQEQQAALLASASVDDLRELVHLYAANVVVNSHRKAIQVLGCSGEVVLHVPLPPDILESLQPESDPRATPCKRAVVRDWPTR